ncbi:MAG: cytochrome-c oxidase [Burkholderiales bacterium RIFCSPLOWO2_02_FULL_57_36]|nr:MAG: cytochrome-c oxidase [Burkholderiales bacterium RIFCSPLOWO2_02_FULL_57_36]
MDLRIVVTVASFIAFIGIVWWAYDGRRKSSFDEAAQLPFADDESDSEHTEKRHG